MKYANEIRSLAFQCTDLELVADANAVLIGSLLPAMRMGVDIHCEEPVSERLLDRLPMAQAILHRWDSELRRVNVYPRGLQACGSRPGGRVGVFFSGGVDSFYSLLRHRDEISDLIFVHGYDVALDNPKMRQQCDGLMRRIGSALGKRVIQVETNLRPWLDAYAGWGELAHGAALAVVGQLLSGELSKIYIPASYTYETLFPWGSHPLLDPLWSSESLEFVHDGCDVSRSEKVAALSTHEIALDSLRVCWQPTARDTLNCGGCEKCVRTMINLRLAGALDRCRTFAEPLTTRLIRRALIKSTLDDPFLLDILDKLNERPELDALRKVIYKAAQRPYRRPGPVRRRWNRLTRWLGRRGGSEART